MRCGHNAATKTHAVVHIRSGKLPGRALFQPRVRALHLATAFNALREHAKFVPDAVAERGQAQRCHRIKKTRSKTAQTPIAQSGVRLGGGHVFERRRAGPCCVCCIALQPQRGQCVAQRAPHQEFHRQIVHAACSGGAVGAVVGNPTLGQMLPCRQRQRVHDLCRLGALRRGANSGQQVVMGAVVQSIRAFVSGGHGAQECQPACCWSSMKVCQGALLTTFDLNLIHKERCCAEKF